MGGLSAFQMNLIHFIVQQPKVDSHVRSEWLNIVKGTSNLVPSEQVNFGKSDIVGLSAFCMNLLRSHLPKIVKIKNCCPNFEDK